MKLTIKIGPHRPGYPTGTAHPTGTMGQMPHFCPLRPAGHFPHYIRQKWGRVWLLLMAMCGLMLAGCTGPAATPILTPTAAASATPTATVIWFPATATATATDAQPATPTADSRPGVGDLLFSDSFDDPAFWNTAGSDDASAILTNNRLVLSITQPGPLAIASLRNQPSAGDFYAEATANISLCSGTDQYGMLFRAAGSGDYYRFVLNCNGQERLERVRGGVAYPLLGWLSSNAVPMGAPAQVKLGVWTVGREMRLFLNETFQFSLTDPVFSAGTFGFFAYANGKSPVTISFSDLSVYSVAYTLPTPSPVPSWTPLPATTLKP
jgi:hypothetical protein